MSEEIRDQDMGRKAKYPDHKDRAEKLMNALLDMTVQVWTSEKEPELKTIAEELEMSPAKLRKLLITSSVRDHQTYYSSDTADAVLSLYQKGKSVAEIQEQTGLSYTSVQGYLPHKTVYNLETMSSECERIRLFRSRKAAVTNLHAHIGLPVQSLTTSGRGGKGGVKFKYTVSRNVGSGGRHYDGEVVEGFGNELWIITGGEEKKKSISRSTVDLALKNAREKEISGPKALGLPGAGSYLYPILVRFGLINPT